MSSLSSKSLSLHMISRDRDKGPHMVVRIPSALREVEIREIEKAMMRFRQLYYDGGNKAGALLANRLRTSIVDREPLTFAVREVPSPSTLIV